MEDKIYLSPVNLPDFESSSDSLEDLPFLAALQDVKKSKCDKVTNKSLQEKLQEHSDLAEGIKCDNISQNNVEEKLKQMKIENHCEDEKKPVLSAEKEFSIYCVNDSLQFFNSRDVTPLLCGYDNRSEELTSIERDLLNYVRVELESVLSSFLLTCHPFSISDCKSFVNFLLYHISVSNDPSCVNACYHRLLSILSEHPHAQDITFSSAEIFMLFFNYGIDVEKCQILEQRPGIKRHLSAPKSKNKSSNKIPDDWTYNLQVLLESFIKLVSTCDFKPKELSNILLFLFWMSLDSSLLKTKFYIIIQDTISACMEHIADDKWTSTLCEFSNVLMSLKFSSESKKWNNLYNMIELVPPTSEMCISLRRHISFVALRLLCANSEIDVTHCEFSLDEFKALLPNLIDIKSDVKLPFAAKFADLCLSHLNANEEDNIELCSIIKQLESALNRDSYMVKSHILKIHSRLKILVGKVSSWQETVPFRIKMEINSPEKKDMPKLKVKTEHVDESLNKDGNSIGAFPTTSSYESMQSESGRSFEESIHNTDKSCESINMESENNLDSSATKLKIRRLSENMYYVAPLVLDENAGSPELPDSDVLQSDNVNNGDEKYAVCNSEGYSKVIPKTEFVENDIVASGACFADSFVDVEEPATFKLENMNNNSDYDRIVDDCVTVDDVTPQDGFAGSNIVVTSVMSCADSPLDVEQPVVFKLEKRNDAESLSCNNPFLIQEFLPNFVENDEPSNALSSGLNILTSKEVVDQDIDFNMDSSINCVIVDQTVMKTEICGEPGPSYNETKPSSYSTAGSPILQTTFSIEPEPDAPMPVIQEIKSLSNITIDFGKERSLAPPHLTEACDPDIMELPIKENFYDNSAQNNSVEVLDIPSIHLDSALNANNFTSGNQSKTLSVISPEHPFMASPKLEEFIPLAVGESISHSPPLVEVLYNPHNVNFANGGLFKADLLKSVSKLGIAQELRSHSCSTESFSRTPETVNEILTRNTESLLQKIDMNLGFNVSCKSSQHSASNVDPSEDDEIVFLKEVESPTKPRKSTDSDKCVSLALMDDSSDKDPQIIFVKKVDSPFKNKNNQSSGTLQKDNDAYAKSSHVKTMKEADIIFLEEKYGNPAKQKPSTKNACKMNSEENRFRDNVKQWLPKASSELQISPVGGVQNCKLSSRSSSTDSELEKLLKNNNIEVSFSSVSSSHTAFSKPNLDTDDNEIVILKEYSPCKNNKNQDVTLIPLNAAKPQLNSIESSSDSVSKCLVIESVQVNDEPVENADIEDLDLTPVQIESECVIPEDSQSAADLVVSDLVCQLIGKIPNIFMACPKIDEVANEEASLDNVNMNVKSEIKDVSKNEKYCLSHKEDNYDNQSETEKINCSDVSKQKHSSDSENMFESDDIMCTDAQLYEDLLLKLKEGGVASSENQVNLEMMSFHTVQRDQNSIPDPEVVSLLNSMTRSIESPNQLDTCSKSSSTFLKSSIKSKENSFGKDSINSSFADVPTVVILGVKGSNISNQNDEKENTKLEEIKSPTIVHIQKRKIAKMSTRSIPLINSNHCVKALTPIRTNALDTNMKSVSVLDNDRNKVLYSKSETGKSGHTDEKNSLSILSSTNSKLNQKRKNFESSNSFSKVQKITDLKTDRNSNTETSRHVRSGKISSYKRQFVSPKKSKIFVPTHVSPKKSKIFVPTHVSPKKSKIFIPTHYQKKKTSPFKSNFKVSPNKSTYNRLKNKALLSKRSLALPQYLQNKVMPSSSGKISKSVLHISDDDSNSDVEILYCDPKKYSDRDCIILYESEDIIVLD